MIKLLKFVSLVWLMYAIAFGAYFVITGNPLVVSRASDDGDVFFQIMFGLVLTMFSGGFLSYMNEIEKRSGKS